MKRALMLMCIALVACDGEKPEDLEFGEPPVAVDSEGDTPIVVPTVPPPADTRKANTPAARSSGTGNGDGILPNGMKEAPVTRAQVKLKIADLKSGDDTTAGMALMGLPHAQHLDLVVPALVDVFQNGNQAPQMRGTAIMMVCGIGPRAKAAVPALVSALDDKDLIAHVWHSMPRIGDAAKPAVPKLVSILETHEDFAMRASAARGLEKFGPLAAGALEPLRKALNSDEHPRVRTAAAWGLGGLGAAAASALPDLEAAGAEGTGVHKFAVNNAIKRIKDAHAE